MTIDRLKAIRKRLEAASPAPWQAHDTQACYYVSNGKGGQFAAFDNRICELAYPFAREDRRRADLDLIAAAPEDLKYLLGEVERLRKILKEIAGEKQNHWPLGHAWQLCNKAEQALTPEVPGAPEGKGGGE